MWTISRTIWKKTHGWQRRILSVQRYFCISESRKPVRSPQKKSYLGRMNWLTIVMRRKNCIRRLIWKRCIVSFQRYSNMLCVTKTCVPILWQRWEIWGEKHKETLFWMREEYRKIVEEIMDKLGSFWDARMKNIGKFVMETEEAERMWLLSWINCAYEGSYHFCRQSFFLTFHVKMILY